MSSWSQGDPSNPGDDRVPPPPQQYPAQPPPVYQPGAQPQQAPGNGFSIAGIVCGAIAFLFCPPLFGLAGLVLGAVARSKGEPKANVALTVSAIGLVVGMIVGALLFSAGGTT